MCAVSGRSGKLHSCRERPPSGQPQHLDGPEQSHLDHECPPTATTHKELPTLNSVHSHIHVTEAQLAIEVFSNITAKPHSLEQKKVNINQSSEKGSSSCFNPRVGTQKREAVLTSPSLMEAATIFFKKSMGWLLYSVFLPPTILLK